VILGAAGHGDDLALDQLKPGLAVAGVEEGEEALEGNPCLDRARERHSLLRSNCWSRSAILVDTSDSLDEIVLIHLLDLIPPRL